MPIKVYKPTTVARRKASVLDTSILTKKRPEKRLTKGMKKKAGRSQGTITVRHKGGGHKRLWRQIDFKQAKYDIPATVKSLEYDPNRSSFIALVEYTDGVKSYILAPHGLQVGDKIIASKQQAEIKVGNRLPLQSLPSGMQIHNIELIPGEGGKLVRSAGSAAVVETIEGKYAQIKMPSGEIRLIPKEAMATIGQVSNPDHRLVRLGKAGRKRWLGIRPTVRGKAMNPVDHPHGGGEGRQPIGLPYPKTPTGKPALGVKTRKRKKWTDKLIIERRKRRR